MIICDSDLCTSCGACINICPRKCISLQNDQYGAPYAYIDGKLCIHCKKCVNVCPVNNNPIFREPLACFAAWDKNEKKRKSSSSGGIAGAIAEKAISNGTVIYGATFKNHKFIICKATDVQSAESYRGSKYVQCMTEETYADVKSNLNEGKQVIYFGTPCQIAGVKNYVGNLDDNLITVDLVCHGTPPASYLESYLKSVLGITFNECNRITFRNDNKWLLNIYAEDKLIYSKGHQLDYYYKSFLAGVIYRKNCYQCPYARRERISDLTLGDFWGLGKKSEFPYSTEKVSLILVNTEKGQQLIDQCTEVTKLERTMEEAVAGNPQLRAPTAFTKDVERFREAIRHCEFRDALKRTQIYKEVQKYRIKTNCIKVLQKAIPQRIYLKIKRNKK